MRSFPFSPIHMISMWGGLDWLHSIQISTRSPPGEASCWELAMKAQSWASLLRWGWSVNHSGERGKEGGCNFSSYTFKFTLKTEWGTIIICNLSFLFHNYIFNSLDYLPLPTNNAHFCNSEATMPQSKNKRTKKLGYN